MQVNVAIALAVVAGCTVNGKPVSFPGGSSSSASSESNASPDATERPAAGSPPGSTCRAQAWGDAWPYLDRPADPGLAVKDGQPVRVSLPTDSYGRLGENLDAVCDAAHDHCLRDCTWLVTESADNHRLAHSFHVDASGAFVEEHWGQRGSTDPQGLVAYRTVPVTRSNVKVGALAMAFEGPVYDGRDPSTHSSGYVRNHYGWHVGTVASIDWDSGAIWFQGFRSPFFLASTRVPVLRYTAGGKVETMPGMDTKAPAVADVIGPGRAAKTSDPWSLVGRDKQPVAADDAHAMSSLSETCSSSFDHCLRPWVWFVDDGRSPAPARWTGKNFVRAANPEMVIGRPGLAYRTRPAKESELKAGTRILYFDNTRRGPASQAAAHETINDWEFGVVDVIDPNFHTFTVKGSSNTYPMDNARLLVLFWLAGEDAAAVE